MDDHTSESIELNELKNRQESTHHHKFNRRAKKLRLIVHSFFALLITCCLLIVVHAESTSNHLAVESSAHSINIEDLPHVRVKRQRKNSTDSSNSYEQYSLYQESIQKIECFNETTKRPQKCTPGFVNAAYSLPVQVTNQCGLNGPSPYCLQNDFGKRPSECDICDARIPEKAHPPSHLTDLQKSTNKSLETWWQSQTMFEGLQNPTSDHSFSQINLTVNLGKTYEIIYVRLKFFSPRPASFVIYKKSNESSDWTPFQYYSHNCLRTYNVSDRDVIYKGNEQKPYCTSEFSDISPLTDGNVVFTTLENRPAARDYENSPELQEFITASSIRISLDRMNTFGEEVFRDNKVEQSYFYGIYDLSVGAVCRCNGHASECIDHPRRRNHPNSPTAISLGKICNCRHNTMGRDCEKCMPFYRDRPWRKATIKDVNECKRCECNDRSFSCEYDHKLFLATGSGGRCKHCRFNFDGPHCEECKKNHYQVGSVCKPCDCNPKGSYDLQCNNQGQCNCRPGVTGTKCDQCKVGHFDFSSEGCRSCKCTEAGSLDNSEICHNVTGQCACKSNVEGLSCNTCKPGFFALSRANEFGCLSCFCFGHSSECKSSSSYHRALIESAFQRSNEDWSVVSASDDVRIEHNPNTKNIGVRSKGDAYFNAPARFLGDQKASYNQYLSFTLRVGELDTKSSLRDVILEGAGMSISQPIFGQGNQMPSRLPQVYRFKLHESHIYGWQPKLQSKDFISVLANLTAIKIRATYTSGHSGTGYLDDVRLETALQYGSVERADWVERCTCPEGYTGQFCESCKPGFRRNPSGGGPFAECIPCNCNGHAKFCDPDTGACICQNNTGGLFCERCSEGFYGDPISGRACKPCPCADGAPCSLLPNGQVACIECPEGHAGLLCDECVDGYYQHSRSRFGLGHSSVECRKCDCSGNVDEYAIGNCDTKTGKCLRCIYSTQGFHCEKCLPGFYGNATARPPGDCKTCKCNHFGTYKSTGPVGTTYETALACHPDTGQCDCKPSVQGRTCNECADGYFNISSGLGCEPCDCNLVGSHNRSCDLVTGQCHCKPGVIGKHCDQCAPLFYGFLRGGCEHCNCDKIGSLSSQCDPDDGKCPCKPNIIGRQCDKCEENKYDKAAGCRDCHKCYQLVVNAVTDIRKKIPELERSVDPDSDTELKNDPKFQRNVKIAESQIESMYNQLTIFTETRGNSLKKLDEYKKILSDLKGSLPWPLIGEIEYKITQASHNIYIAQSVIDEKLDALRKLKFEQQANEIISKIKETEDLETRMVGKVGVIAREATKIAESHEDQVAEIENLVKQALNESNQANKLFIASNTESRLMSEKISELRSKIDKTDEKMRRVLVISDEVRNDSARAMDDALRIATDLKTIEIPEYNSRQLLVTANQLLVSGKTLLDNARKTLENYEKSYRGTVTLNHEAHDLYIEASQQQRIADDLLAEVQKYLVMTQESLSSGESTLAEVLKISETFKEFDRIVSESRNKAETAKKQIPAIRARLAGLERYSGETHNNLKQSLVDVSEAESIANKSATEAERIQASSHEIRANVSRLSSTLKRVDDYNDNLKWASRDMSGVEEAFETEHNLIQISLVGANRAKSVVTNATNIIESMESNLAIILKSADEIDDIDEDEIIELENAIEQIEKSQEIEQLDSLVQDKKQLITKQELMMREFITQINQLRKDVANLQEIRNTIPEKCLREAVLEVPQK